MYYQYFIIFYIRLPGRLKHISASDNRLWGVAQNDDIFTARNIRFTRDGQIHLDWHQIGGLLRQLSVSVHITQPGKYY